MLLHCDQQETQTDFSEKRRRGVRYGKYGKYTDAKGFANKNLVSPRTKQVLDDSWKQAEMVFPKREILTEFLKEFLKESRIEVGKNSLHALIIE